MMDIWEVLVLLMVGGMVGMSIKDYVVAMFRLVVKLIKKGV